MKAKKTKPAKKPKMVTVVRWLFRDISTHCWSKRKPRFLRHQPTELRAKDRNQAIGLCEPAWPKDHGLPELERGQCVRIELTYPKPEKSKP